jgi:hypothetical protein
MLRTFYKHYKAMEHDFRARFPLGVMIRLAIFSLVVLTAVG